MGSRAHGCGWRGSAELGERRIVLKGCLTHTAEDRRAGRRDRSELAGLRRARRDQSAPPLSHPKMRFGNLANVKASNEMASAPSSDSATTCASACCSE